MKHKVIFEISYKISPDEWVRVGLNVDDDDDNTPPDHLFNYARTKVEGWLTQVVADSEEK